jgi:hypothetical protein
VISSRELRRMASERGGLLLADVDGHPIGDGAVATGASVPGLLVGPVTDAVKVMDDGAIVHHMDRDTLWAVEGFLLDDAVLEGLGDFVGSSSELIEAVAAAGHEWKVID